MRVTLKIDDLGTALKRAYDDGEVAVSAAMTEVQAGLKDELRGQIVGAGMGQRLAKTWRGTRYPEGRPSINSVAYVWSRAPDIVDAFERGVPIIARNRRFLAVPTKDAGVSHTTVKNRRLTYQRGNLRQSAHFARLIFPESPAMSPNAPFCRHSGDTKNEGPGR